MDELGIVEQLKKINDNLDKLVKIFTSQIIITNTKDTDLNIKEVNGQINTTNIDKRVDINSRLVGCIIDNNCVKMSDELKEKFKSLQKDIMATSCLNVQDSEMIKEGLENR